MTKKIFVGVAAVLVLASIGYLVFGDYGFLAGILGLIGVGAGTAKKRAAVQKAREDFEAAQRQRDELKKQFAAIDAKTEQDVAQIAAGWEKKKGRPPTAAEEAELLSRYGVKPPPPRGGR